MSSTKYKQLDRDTKVKILTLVEEGVSYREIARKIGYSHSTVVRFIQKKENQDPLERKKGTGPKRKTSDQDDRILRRISLQNRFKSGVQISSELRENYNIDISAETVRRRLREVGLHARRPAKKPLLSAKMKAARLKWAKKYENWTVENWRSVIWSDESKFNLFASDRTPHVRRRTGENCLLQTVRSSPSQMVWGCFSYHVLGQLHFINDTVNAEYYKRIIQDNLVPSIEEHLSFTIDCVFQDDSAPCHRAQSLNILFSDLGIHRLDWPGNSPDLNPIENLWHSLKHKVAVNKPTTKEKLRQILEKVWYEEISLEEIQNLVDSMPSRI